MKAGGHAAHGHARKHTHASKHVHGKHPKHHPHHAKTAHHHHRKAHRVHTVGHHQSHAKGLALSPGDVACCVSQALAESLRLCQGLPVSGADVLALHRAAGADDDRGAPILAVLEAASEIGIAGQRLQRFEVQADLGVRQGGDSLPGVGGIPGVIAEPGHVDLADWLGIHAIHDTPLILGVDLPGPHTVLATPEGWWSWGELFCPWCDFPDAVIDEAWVIAWQ